MQPIAAFLALMILGSLHRTLSFSPPERCRFRASSHPRKLAAFEGERECHDVVDSAEHSAKTTIPQLATRSKFLSTMAGACSMSFIVFCKPSTSNGFDGGVGGLGKTKPETGVQLFSEVSAPVQNSAGIVSAELNVSNQPVLVTFQTPWPLLPSTTGLEARNLQQPESAFVQVLTENEPSELPLTKHSMKKLLLTSVFAQQGKFGAYGAPTDVKVKATEDPSVFLVSFTTLTPGLRESERQAFIKYSAVGSSLVLLVTGTTTPRFKKQEGALQKVVTSFNAVAAPSSRLR